MRFLASFFCYLMKEKRGVYICFREPSSGKLLKGLSENELKEILYDNLSKGEASLSNLVITCKSVCGFFIEQSTGRV